MNIWVTEDQTDNLRISFRVKEIIASDQSEYQACAIYDTEAFGRLMMLDDVVMLTERDEFCYHEMMAHVPLSVHPHPKRVLVIGGGDGGTVREVARYPEVDEITLVEIDRMVVEMSRKYLPFVASGLDDPRVTIRIEDGIRFIQEQDGAYDVIIIDSTDPVAFAEGLFHADFYRDVAHALAKDGIMVAQTEFPLLMEDTVRQVYAALREVFPLRRMYTGVVPTYPTGYWSYAFASLGPDPIADMKPERTAPFADRLRYYTPEIHQAAFILPPVVRQLLD